MNKLPFLHLLRKTETNIARLLQMSQLLPRTAFKIALQLRPETNARLPFLFTDLLGTTVNIVTARPRQLLPRIRQPHPGRSADEGIGVGTPQNFTDQLMLQVLTSVVISRRRNLRLYCIRKFG
jgi:hypothetical protein